MSEEMEESEVKVEKIRGKGGNRGVVENGMCVRGRVRENIHYYLNHVLISY